MSIQDLTADMLTRIRNALRNREKSVVTLSNKLNRGVASVLKEEGYISDFEHVADGRGERASKRHLGAPLKGAARVRQLGRVPGAEPSVGREDEEVR